MLWVFERIENTTYPFRLEMVFTVEMNKDTSPTSLADTASEAESIKQNGDGSKSRKVCCQVMGVVKGLI